MDELKDLVKEYVKWKDRYKAKEEALERMDRDMRKRVCMKYDKLLKQLPKDFVFDNFWIGNTRILIKDGQIWIGRATIEEAPINKIAELYLKYDDIKSKIEEQLRHDIEEYKNKCDEIMKEIKFLYEFLDGMSNDY